VRFLNRRSCARRALRSSWRGPGSSTRR
jgi:hypothetical protein